MTTSLLPLDSRRGRLARVFLGVSRCLHPDPLRRGDLGEVLVAAGRPYPYRWWLRIQRRRRRADHLNTPSASEVTLSHADGQRWEADAAGLIGEAVAAGATMVQFHEDGPSSDPRVRIRPTPGPVGMRSTDLFGASVFLRAEPDDPGVGAAPVRVDEVLLHLPTAPVESPPRRPPPARQPVAVVVPSPGNTALLEGLFVGLRSEATVAEVVIVDNSPSSRGTNDFYRHWGAELPLEVIRTDPEQPFNYSRSNNIGAGATTAPVLAFCNDDLEFTGSNSFGGLAGWLEVDGIGAVGPQLRYPDGSIQHGGVVIGLNGLAEHAFTGMRPGTDTLIGNTDSPRDVSAVTGACLLTTRDVYDAVGGFDEDLVLTGSDVWYCLRAAELGWGTAYDGGIALVHHESAARGDTNLIDDVIGSARRWGDLLDSGDPYWSKRLAIHRHEPTLRRPSDPTSREMLEAYMVGRGVSPEVIDNLR